MSALTLTATALAGACGGRLSFARLPSLGASVAEGPASVSVGGAAATVPVDDCGAESAMWVSAPFMGVVPERCG